MGAETIPIELLERSARAIEEAWELVAESRRLTQQRQAVRSWPLNWPPFDAADSLGPK